MATATAAAGASETRIVIPNVAWEIFESLAASDCAGTPSLTTRECWKSCRHPSSTSGFIGSWAE